MTLRMCFSWLSRRRTHFSFHCLLFTFERLCLRLLDFLFFMNFFLKTNLNDFYFNIINKIFDNSTKTFDIYFCFFKVTTVWRPCFSWNTVINVHSFCLYLCGKFERLLVTFWKQAKIPSCKMFFNVKINWETNLIKLKKRESLFQRSLA